MGIEVNLEGLVDCAIYGKPGRTDRCQICLNYTADGEVLLDDEVSLQNSYTPNHITMKELLKKVTGIEPEDSSVLPRSLCTPCSFAAIRSYEFIKLCEDSSRRWHDLPNMLDDVLSSPNISSHRTKSLYLYMNRTETVTHLGTLPFVDMETTRSKVKHIFKYSKARLRKDNLNNRIVRKLKGPHQCDYCGKKYNVKRALVRHIEFCSRGLNNLECHICNIVLKRPTVYVTHMARFHTEKTFQCAQCPKRFGSQKLLNSHKRANHPKESYVCGKCGEQSPSYILMVRHERSHMIDPCEKCGKKFKELGSLQNHMCVNLVENNTFPCEFCDKHFWSRNSIRLHIKRVHSDQPWKCEKCHIKFFEKYKMHDHIASVHEGVKRHLCVQCDERFVSRNNLLKHINTIHLVVKPYPCPGCDARFPTSFKRLEHIRRYHDDMELPACSVCDKKFLDKYELNKHYARHIDPKTKMLKK